MALRRTDVVIVGAGPAGCAAAYDLACAGIEVLLLDRKTFPRVKPCAGMLTIKAVKRLRYSIAPVIRFVARDLSIGLGREKSWLLPSSAPIAVMTVRENFDAFCLKRTLEAGAQFETVGEPTAVMDAPGGVVLKTGSGDYHCRYLIGADGANSRMRRLLGVSATERALAIEGRIAGAGAARFDFRAVEGGYGWIFPKGDHLNAGLYTQRAGVALSKRDLKDYTAVAAGTDYVDDIVGYPIGIGGEAYAPVHARVFLAGDAMGATERLLGEGIHNAIASGQAVASAIAAAIHDGKAALPRVKKATRDIQRDLQACAAAAVWFYDMPEARFATLATHKRWSHLMRGFAAGLTFRDISRSLLLSRFYRVNPVPSVVEYEKVGLHS